MSKARQEEVCGKREQLRITHTNLVKELDSAQRSASDLRARVIELESQVNAPTHSVAEHTQAIRDLDRYRVLLQSNAAQLQGLQDGYAEIASRQF